MFMFRQKRELHNSLYLPPFSWVAGSNNFLFFFLKWFLIFSFLILFSMNSNHFSGFLIYPLQQNPLCNTYWKPFTVAVMCNDFSCIHAFPGLFPCKKFPSPSSLPNSCLSFKTQLTSTLRSSAWPWPPSSILITFLVISLIKHWY